MTYLIFAATATFFYVLEPNVSYQACYQKQGAPAATCQALTTSPFVVSGLDDDADYNFWIKANGVESAKVPVHTQKKTVVPPAIALN